MAKYVLAVYDACQVYLERFMEYTGTKGNLCFSVKGYTDLSILADEMQNNKIDAVLFSVDDMFMDSVEILKGVLAQIMVNKTIVLILGEQHSAGELKKKVEERGYEDEIRIIEKFQAAEHILLEADEFIQAKKGKIDRAGEFNRFQIKGLYSPADKVTHPEAAALLKEDDEKTLYINLEPFSGLNSLAETMPGSDLSDAIYYYKTSSGKLPEILNRIRGKLNGMDYLPGPANVDDLEILDGEDWPGLLRELSVAGDYQLIIIDSHIFSRKLFDMILTYGSLYIPALPYDSARTYRSVLTAGAAGEERRKTRMAAKIREFRQYFEDSELCNYQDRILEVQLETD